MKPPAASRRQFLAQAAGIVAGAGLLAPHAGGSTRAADAKPRSPNERLGIGAIGMRYQGTVITLKAQQYGEVRAVCDVDRHVRDQAQASFGSTPKAYEDYRELLADKRVDVVMIGTPDHWHAKMAIDACRAGKDVYVEKPLTLTIDEGKLLRKVAQETGRVVQVGSWQRSDHRFRAAVEMVRQGRLGKLQRVDIVLDKHPTGGPFERRPVPGNLNWDLWLGQAPAVPYIPERCHYTFRWWYEYAGGKMTDWGAHHLDIGQWAIGSQPVEIESRANVPRVADGYNVPIDYEATYRYANGVVMTVKDEGRNGILFTGDAGRIFVSRGSLSGKPVEQLAADPLPRQDFKLYDFDNLERPERVGKLDAIVNHMGNFFDCVASRRQPLSDVESQHRSATTCHLGNISMRLGRPLRWDPETEDFVDDAEANALLTREQRKGYEVV
ncbi:MAG TPA: Gfo/Idh/MocA family oxidoreductase [Pirellulales bacterium]|nr:Gfo/Idh/MocA family oxidoreductase [Pirellulales bacterium]